MKCGIKYLNGRLGSAIAGLIFLGASIAGACPIPVFQYSLEYWEPDPYDVTVHYIGELADSEQELVDRLRNRSGDDRHNANISVSWRDHSVMDNPNPSGKEIPRLEVSYPSISGIRGTLLETSLSEEAIEELLHSPLREKIAKKLLDRQAGVWVLLESGDRSKDRRVRELLEKELPRLEKTLKVVDPKEQYGIDMGEIYTDVNFSMVSLSRDDPDEQVFIKMLLGTERDLDEYEDQPMVFPIYGRGLIMYALIGDGINEWTLNSAGEFLTGPCSCQVKQSNPGTDILMDFDWESQVEQRSTYETPGAAAGGFMDRADEAEERLRE